jgi:hypothetical protein
LALRLFDLLNLIVEATITATKNVDEMFSKLPERALKSIEARDRQGSVPKSEDDAK